MRKYRVELFLTEDDRHSPYLFEGLLALEKKGDIDLVIKSMPFLFKNRWVLNAPSHRSSRGYPWCPEVIVTRADKESRRIGFDLQDWTQYFSFHAINNCDVIFKRAYDPLLVGEYERKVPNKIVPMGPNHSCKITDPRVLRKIEESRRKQLLAKAISEPSKIKQALYGKIRPKARRTPAAEVKNTLSAPLKSDYVFFQVECHGWKSNAHASGLNEYRADLIRKLRSELGDRFIGGMFFKGEVDPAFEDCMTNVDPSPANYRMFVENAAVVVSANGFGGSIPWKLTEYMRWGSCIVTEKNRHAFRESMITDTVNEFETPDQCVALCIELLGDKTKRMLQKTNSKKYYVDHIAPERSILRILDSAFESVREISLSNFVNIA